MYMKHEILLFFIVLSVCTYSQTDWNKWEKAELSYLKMIDAETRDYKIGGENIAEVIANTLTSSYWFLVSDVDGDNCPFKPSCSTFFVEVIKETNLLQGTVMFFDRFTRDMNIFNRDNKYPRFSNKYYYDPVSLYTLENNRIQYLPPGTQIKSE